MGVINIVKEYPEVFGKVGETIDEEDAWRIIASVQSHGSTIEKDSISVYIQFNAIYNLFQIGLRDQAVELALELLKNAIESQYFEVAQKLCKLLVEDSFLMDDIDSAQKYDLLYRKYSEITELEYDAKFIYGKLLFNHNKGIESNEIEIIRAFSQIKEKLSFDNLMYHYYYHSCLLILASESEYEGRLLSAINYFDNLYYVHNSYLSPFVIKLALRYQKNGQYNNAKNLLEKQLERCKEGSIVWFKYMKTACLVYLSSGEMIKAKFCIDRVNENEKFQDLSNKDKVEWKQFRSINN